MNNKLTCLVLIIIFHGLLFSTANEICSGKEVITDSAKLIKEYEFNFQKAETITNGQKSLRYSMKALEISKRLQNVNGVELTIQLIEKESIT